MERPLTSVTVTLANKTFGVPAIERDFNKQPDGSWQLLTRDMGVEGTWNVRVTVESPTNTFQGVDFTIVIVSQPGSGS